MDFDESSDRVVTQEFLAVLLAGFGKDLVPLTSNHGDEPCPKALLPIANKPMLDYPLSWLESSGIRNVLLICPTLQKDAISHYLNADSSVSSFPSLSIDLQGYDETQDTNDGTCEVLRHFANRIKQDFVLLPCDFIPSPSFPMSRILNKFRTEATYDGAIATTCFYESSKPEKGAVTEEWGMLPPATPVVWDQPTGTLLHIDTPDDQDRNSEDIELPMSLLSSYPRSRLSAGLQDAHVYVCRRSVIDLLQEKPYFESVREEFIPWLCKLQYSHTRREKYGKVVNPPSNHISHRIALQHSTLHARVARDVTRNPTSQPNTAPSSPVEEEDEADENVSLRVGVVVHSGAEGFAARANTLHSYLELNRHFLSQTSWTLPTDAESRAMIDPKAQISNDSMVGHTTRVDERTSIKKSVIGKHCIIGKMAKIVGCVILDHCVIADGAKLDGCILGKNTKIGTKAELSRCVTQAGYEVESGEQYRNEKLDVSDWTAMGGDDSTGEEDTESDEDS